MFPMLEMAHGHIAFIPDVLYVYNNATPFNDCKTKLIKQLEGDITTRSWKKVRPIGLPIPAHRKNKQL